MPTLSIFYGIAILMFIKDHDPPHFHARYAEFDGRFEIDPLRKISGDLPARAERLVMEWARLHLDELKENWERRVNGRTLFRIPGLR